MFPLNRDETRQLGTLCFGGGAMSVRRVAGTLGIGDACLDVRHLRTQRRDTRLEKIELFTPCGHFARRKIQLDGEATLRQLGVSFGPFALTSE